MSKKNSLTVEKTATYYSLGDVKTAKTIWIVLHGYGYLAEFFIKKFEPILNKETCVIAPEGLSRFYLNGFNGRVGASWMTKQSREEEIIDYINYLQKLYETILTANNNLFTKINIVGFSQGGATACRWFSAKQIKCTNFILWASVFPEDFDFSIGKKDSNIYLIYGTSDEFLTPNHLTLVKNKIEKTTIDCQVISFDGPHDIPKDVLIEQTELNNW